MAKKTSVKRVHQLAKELGVSSKDIVSKCQAEGIPDITNHMSAISVGLSVTVCEWFGEGSSASTAVETAAPVDVAAARKKAPRKKAAPKIAAKATVKAAATAVEEPALETVPAKVDIAEIAASAASEISAREANARREALEDESERSRARVRLPISDPKRKSITKKRSRTQTFRRAPSMMLQGQSLVTMTLNR